MRRQTTFRNTCLRIVLFVLLVQIALSIVYFAYYPDVARAFRGYKMADMQRKRVDVSGVRTMLEARKQAEKVQRKSAYIVTKTNDTKLWLKGDNVTTTTSILSPASDSAIFIFSAIQRSKTSPLAVYINAWTRRYFMDLPLINVHCCFYLTNGTLISVPVSIREPFHLVPFTGTQYQCLLHNTSVLAGQLYSVTIVLEKLLTNFTSNIHIISICKDTSISQYVTVESPISVEKTLENSNKTRLNTTNLIAVDQSSLEVNQRSPFLDANVSFSFAICGKLIYGYTDPNFLVGWFEYYLRLGVNKFVLYTHHLSPMTSHVLDYYVTSGVLEVHPFDYPRYKTDKNYRKVGDKNYQTWSDEQVVVFDCQERLREFKYVSLVDVDELIVPMIDRSLEGLLNRLYERSPFASLFMFDTQMHTMQWEQNRTEDIAIAQYPQYIPQLRRPKYVYMPSRVVPGSIHTHHQEYKLAPFLWKSVPSQYAMLHHYRRKCSWDMLQTNECFRARRRYDNTVQRVFVDEQLRTAIADVKSRLAKPDV